MTYSDLALAHLFALSLHSPCSYTILTPQPAQAGLQIYRVSSQLVCFTLVACLCLEYSSSGFRMAVPFHESSPSSGISSSKRPSLTSRLPVPLISLYFVSLALTRAKLSPTRIILFICLLAYCLPP